MNDITMTEINARLEVLCAQRNQALDQAAVYAGKLSAAQQEIEELGNLDDNELAELLDGANDLIIEGDVLDMIARNMLNLEFNEEESVSLDLMLRNAGLVHYNDNEKN